MKTIKYLWFGILFITFPMSLSSTENVENISIKTSVIFNTQCAKCHEGECSGRLSFDTGTKTASKHIKRYVGDMNISNGEVEEFFSLLNYMKTECALWMPDNVKWTQKNLSDFALPSAKAYFIPLGVLKKGQYNLEIKQKADIHFRVEILSDHFEHFLDIWACPNREKDTLQFTIDKPVNTFLRIQSRKPLQIIDLSLLRLSKT